MASLNKAQLIGYVGADPEVRTVNDGKTVAKLRIATNERWTDASGEKRERTDWHTVIAWNQPGKFCSAYVRKGHAVYVEGSMQTRAWLDREGTKRYTTEIVARSVQLLDRKGEEPAHAEDTQEEATIAAAVAGDVAPPKGRRKRTSS